MYLRLAASQGSAFSPWESVFYRYVQNFNKERENVRIKIVVSAALCVLGFAGAAKAAGVFDSSDPQNPLLQRERALIMQSVHGQTQGASASRVRRGPRGPRGSKGQTGASGPKGATGATGPAGPAGSFSSFVEVSGPETTLCGFEFLCSVGSAHAECPAGTHVISGGWAGVFFGTVYFSASEGNGWSVGIANEDTSSASYYATALCAS